MGVLCNSHSFCVGCHQMSGGYWHPFELAVASRGRFRWAFHKLRKYILEGVQQLSGLAKKVTISKKSTIFVLFSRNLVKATFQDRNRIPHTKLHLKRVSEGTFSTSFQKTYWHLVGLLFWNAGDNFLCG